MDRGKKLMIWIAKTMRRWIPMYKQDLGKGDRSDPEAGVDGVTTTKSWMAAGGGIKIGNVGFSVFGDGLYRCDSV